MRKFTPRLGTTTVGVRAIGLFEQPDHFDEGAQTLVDKAGLHESLAHGARLMGVLRARQINQELPYMQERELVSVRTH